MRFHFLCDWNHPPLKSWSSWHVCLYEHWEGSRASWIGYSKLRQKWVQGQFVDCNWASLSCHIFNVFSPLKVKTSVSLQNVTRSILCVQLPWGLPSARIFYCFFCSVFRVATRPNHVHCDVHSLLAMSLLAVTPHICPAYWFLLPLRTGPGLSHLNSLKEPE